MKNYMILLFIILCSTLNIQAQERTCFRCGEGASCYTLMYEDQIGYQSCTGGHTCCHYTWGGDINPDAVGPCEPHCHVSYKEYSFPDGSVYIEGCNTRCSVIPDQDMFGSSVCQDCNQNGVCDWRDGNPPPEERERADMDPQQCGSYGCGWEYGTPLVVNLSENSSWQGAFTGRDDLVSFDITGDNVPDLTTWTTANSEIAFIALDRNNNGRIDGVSELFGGVDQGTGEVNGFDLLAHYDVNGPMNSPDGFIDEFDDFWKFFLLWRDINHNGVSEPQELFPLSNYVTWINLNYKETERLDREGNMLRYKTTALVNGKRRTIFDVFFLYKATK